MIELFKWVFSSKFFCWAFTFFLYTVLIIDFFRLFLGAESGIVVAVRACIVCITTLYILLYYIHRNSSSILLLFWLSWSILFILTILINYKDNENYLLAFGNEYTYFIGKSLVGFFFAFALKDYHYFFKIQKKVLLIPILYSLSYLVIYSEKAIYNMSMSYSLLLPAIISTFFYIDEKRFKFLFFSICMLIAILVLGSRGPLLCYAFSMMFYYFFSHTGNSKKIMLLCPVIIIVCIMFYSYFIELLWSLFPGSRTIGLLTHNYGDLDAFSLSGREAVYPVLLDYLQDNMLSIKGPFGDRVLLDDLLGLGSSYILHPHNILLEFLVQYGLLFGSIIVCILSYLSLRTYILIKKRNNRDYIKFYSYFVSVGLLHFFWSGSYLSNENFWIFMAFLLVNNYRKSLN